MGILIEAWLQSTKIQILVNVEPARDIICYIGLRKRDLLSPLFILVVNDLNKLVLKGKDVGLISRLLGSQLSTFIKLCMLMTFLSFDITMLDKLLLSNDPL